MHGGSVTVRFDGFGGIPDQSYGRVRGGPMEKRKAALKLLQSAREHLKEHVDECGLWQEL
jgi:hypothetical protein